MNFNISNAVGWALLCSVALHSCTAREAYQRPQFAEESGLYRNAPSASDSTGLGHLSWREMFTDPLLQKHISEALANNLDIKTAAQNIIAAEAYLKQSQAAYFPTLNAGPGYGISTASLNGAQGQFSGNTRRYINSFNISADASWEADLWGRLKSIERAQRANYFAELQAENAVKSDVVAAVAGSYYQLLAFDNQKKIIEKTIEVRKKNLETSRALKQAGVLTEVAVQQNEALVHNAEAQLISIETEIELLENTISLLKGEASKSVERSTLEAQQPNFRTDTGYPIALLANRPDVMEAENALRSAFEMKNAARAAFYPTLRITAGTGLQSGNIDNFFSLNSLFGNMVSGLTAPVFNRRQIRTNYEVAEVNRERAYLNFRRTILTAGREVSDAIRRYSVQDAYIALKQKEVDNYNRSVEYSQQLVNYGMANYLEVLNASVNALNAELNISNARYAKLRAGVDLYHALGGGWK